MMALYVPENVIEALSGSHMFGIFVRVETDPPLRVWFGVNEVPANFDSIDPDDEEVIYLGGGALIGVPTLEVLVNGTSDSVEFTISGLDPATGNKTIEILPPVRGAAVHIGITTLDECYQPMSAIIPLWEGIASHPGETSGAVKSDQSPTVTLSLAVVSGERTRSRPARSMWSSAHQKAISATDKFCDATARLARGVQPTWTLGY